MQIVSIGLFSKKNKKNISFSSAEFAQRLIKLFNHPHVQVGAGGIFICKGHICSLLNYIQQGLFIDESFHLDI